MRYDFDTVIDRRGTYAIKWSQPDPDIIPLMVADMDLPVPQSVVDACRELCLEAMNQYAD